MRQEMSPEQFDGHLAAMEAEPWGEERADHRLAFLLKQLQLLLKPEWGDIKAEDFLAAFRHFATHGEEYQEERLKPGEAAKRSRES